MKRPSMPCRSWSHLDGLIPSAGYPILVLILVDGNPLKNLKYLYPTGVEEMNNGKMVHRGGVQWTIKDGFIYHAPTMLEDVKKIVDQAKSAD